MTSVTMLYTVFILFRKRLLGFVFCNLEYTVKDWFQNRAISLENLSHNFFSFIFYLDFMS